MVLKNFACMLGSAFSRQTSAKANSGTLVNWGTNPVNNVVPASPGTRGWNFRLGTGNTAATINDYVLDTDVTSSLTYVSSTLLAEPNVQTYDMLSYVFVYKNNTASDITIKEVGLAYDTGYGGGYILINRKVLSSPLEMKAGKTYAFTATISMAHS